MSDPIRELIETSRAVLAIWGEAGLDYYPQYSDLMAAIDRAEMLLDEPELIEVR